MAGSSLVLYDPHTADREVIAAAGFLAGYSGRTREAYTLDLRNASCSGVSTTEVAPVSERPAISTTSRRAPSSLIGR